MPINMKGQSLLTIEQLTPAQMKYLLELAIDLKAKKRAGVRGQLLAGKNIALIFEKSSTRTRCAFVVAAVDEGAHPEFLGANDIHIGGKESIEDTARVLGRMFDGIQFRGFKQSVVEALAQHAGVPVWNGLTDYAHPTQILADFMTIQEHLGKLKGLRFVYVGDGRNNMANSLMMGCAKMGMHFVNCAPQELMPSGDLVERAKKIAAENGATITFETDPKKGVKDADVIYTDVWASMGEEAQKAERVRLLTPYQVNEQLMKATGKPETLFMHCLPAVKGEEVTYDVFESKCSVVFDEAENRMHTIKAVMVATLA
ncbi:MAG: ornithine carbamoyltransferase [Bacteroidota bacterium]